MPMNFYKFEKFKRAELPCHKVGQEKRATVFGENEDRLSMCDSIFWDIGNGLLCVNSPNSMLPQGGWRDPRAQAPFAVATELAFQPLRSRDNPGAPEASARAVRRRTRATPPALRAVAPDYDFRGK